MTPTLQSLKTVAMLRVLKEGTDMDKATLEALWEQATDLPDAQESPLAKAIITEAMCGEPTCDHIEAARRVYQIADDCEQFAGAIARAQGEVTHA